MNESGREMEKETEGGKQWKGDIPNKLNNARIRSSFPFEGGRIFRRQSVDPSQLP
jgi:hypothetical protein